MDDSVRAGCAALFREISGLENSPAHFRWSDEKLCAEPLDTLDVDSLTLLEFVMEVENHYKVELNEERVNRCKSVGDLVALVVTARNGPN